MVIWKESQKNTMQKVLQTEDNAKYIVVEVL